jgi:hypothetical protein
MPPTFYNQQSSIFVKKESVEVGGPFSNWDNLLYKPLSAKEILQDINIPPICCNHLSPRFVKKEGVEAEPFSIQDILLYKAFLAKETLQDIAIPPNCPSSQIPKIQGT